MSVESLADPSLAAARSLVADALDAGATVTLVGRCSATYAGRASGHLGPGERLVVLKPDGTLLVHTDSGRTPVVWQPPGAHLSVTVADDRLRVRAGRGDGDAVVRFERVTQASALDLADDAEFELAGSEADLRRRVLEAPDLVEPGFRPLATERETPAGPVDVYGEDADGNAVVLELKRRRVGPDAVGQLARYVEALERDLHADATVRGLLLAPSVTDRARRLLAERGLEFVPLSPDGA